MTGRASIDARLDAALAANPPRVPVLTGASGSGRSALLLRLRARLGASRCQYVDVERVASTPERFLRAVVAASPFVVDGPDGLPAPPGSTRDAFETLVAFLATARTRDHAPATFLLDEVLEIRTFESFPGLRTALADLVGGITDSPNRFVLSTRYATRARKLLGPASDRLDFIAAPPLSVADVARVLAERDAPDSGADGETALLLHALSDGQPAAVDAIAVHMAHHGAPDPISALVAMLGPNGPLTGSCRYTYELRLHRARGYGALKAILGVLADEEPLTLTAISHRLSRTPGSTKDYLTWLEDVDLVNVEKKHYRFADPLLRLWVRLHTRPTPPTDDDVAREVRGYAAPRLPRTTAPAPRPDPGDGRRSDATRPAPVVAPRTAARDETPGEPDAVAAASRENRGRLWGIIEID